MEDISMKCQNCKLPLRIDSSLLDLSLAQADMLVSSVNECTQTEYKIPQDRLQRMGKVIYPNETNLQKLGLDSYVFLKDDLKHEESSAIESTDTSQMTSTEQREDDSGDEQMDDERQRYAGSTVKTLSTQVSALANVFNILSSKSNIDYPVCQDCCNILVRRIQSEYDDSIKERDLYTQFLSKIEKQKTLNPSDFSEDSTHEAERLQAKKDKLFQELLKLENENENLDNELADLEKQLDEEKKMETEDLKRKNQYELEQIAFFKEVQSLKSQYSFTLNNLDKLRKINIYNETFKISHDGPFGVINGLRIGGFEDVKVPWQEINAAIGQVVLLLATITTRLELRLDGYKLLPMGSYSKISRYQDDISEWETYEAFNNDNFKIGKLFHKETNFDRAMESLLVIIRQMAFSLSRSRSYRQESVHSIVTEANELDDEEIDLPYLMHKDKINGISVKLFGGRPTIEWTTAMKFVLTNTKWLLAFSSSQLG